MRMKQNARKTTSGRTLNQSHQEMILKNLRRGRQSESDSDSNVDMNYSDENMTLEVTVEDQNNRKSTENRQVTIEKTNSFNHLITERLDAIMDMARSKKVQPIALTEMTSDETNNVIIDTAAGQNESNCFQQLPMEVVNELEETPQRTRHCITIDEQKSPATNSIAHPVRLPSNIEVISTDVIVIDDPISSSSPEKRVSTDKLLEIKRKSLKNSSTNKSRHKKTYTKRTMENQVKSCKELIKKYDKEILLDTLLADSEISARKLLQGYKKKRNKNKWNKEEIREEASRVLNINFISEIKKEAAEMSPLQKCLVEFSNFAGDHFVDTILETFGGQFEAAKVLEILKLEELKSAILCKFSAAELWDLICRSEVSNTTQEILKTIPVDQIVNHIQSRTDLNTSESLLNVLLENFSQIVPDETNQNLENNVVVNSNSKNIMINRVVDLVKSKEDLKTSEQLLNIMLQHAPTLVSDETKNNIKNFLMRKFSAAELNDMTHEIISFHLAKKKMTVITSEVFIPNM